MSTAVDFAAMIGEAKPGRLFIIIQPTC